MSNDKQWIPACNGWCPDCPYVIYSENAVDIYDVDGCAIKSDAFIELSVHAKSVSDFVECQSEKGGDE